MIIFQCCVYGSSVAPIRPKIKNQNNAASTDFFFLVLPFSLNFPECLSLHPRETLNGFIFSGRGASSKTSYSTAAAGKKESLFPPKEKWERSQKSTCFWLQCILVHWDSHQSRSCSLCFYGFLPKSWFNCASPQRSRHVHWLIIHTENISTWCHWYHNWLAVHGDKSNTPSNTRTGNKTSLAAGFKTLNHPLNNECRYVLSVVVGFQLHDFTVRSNMWFLQRDAPETQ